MGARENKKDFAFSVGGVVHHDGMTKCEYVSSQILGALLNCEDSTKYNVDSMAQAACEFTDALFEEWERREKKDKTK